MLHVAEPILGAEEKSALAEVIDSNWITMGSRVEAFEKKFAECHNVDDAVAVSSCTAGLHLLLAALGIGPGDEVLVPSMTFVATINSVLYVGATPVFVDIESLERPLMSLEDAAAKCTERTRAVIMMHYAGYLAPPIPWHEFARRHGLMLVEDSAHAVGISGVGTYGDGAAFSFYGNKNMTTAEGGMVIARDAAVLQRVRQLRGHGMTSGTFQRLNARTPNYDVTMLGFNYRMDELRAAIGTIQLSHLPEWNARRSELTGVYRTHLARHCPEVMVPFGRDERSSHHILAVVLPAHLDRQSVVAGLRDAGIQSTIHYPPVHQLTYFEQRFPSVYLPFTEAFGERELTLPLHPGMTDEEALHVVYSLEKCMTRKEKRPAE